MSLGQGIENFNKFYKEELIKSTEGLGLIIGVIVACLIGSGMIESHKTNKKIQQITSQLGPLLKIIESKVVKTYKTYTDFIKLLSNKLPPLLRKYKMFKRISTADDSLLDIKTMTENITEKIARAIFNYRKNNLSKNFNYYFVGTVLSVEHDKVDYSDDDAEIEYQKFCDYSTSIVEKFNNEKCIVECGDGWDEGFALDVTLKLDISAKEIAQWSEFINKHN